MKLLVLFIWINSFTLNAQLSDTTCIKERWISLERTVENASLFESNKEEIGNSLLGKVKELAESHELNIYTTKFDVNRREVWYAVPLVEKHMGLYKNDTITTRREDFFQIEIQSTAPQVDEYGEFIIITNEVGITSFLYPPPTIHAFTMDDIVEIRIKEIKNASSQQIDKFSIVGFSFCHNFQGDLAELFWIDAIEFQRLLTKTDFPWYDLLFNQKYRGFQYMQTSCYD